MAIIKNLSSEDYNKLEGLRSSVLKELTKSPLHAKYAQDNERPETPALLFGRWLHSYLLEHESFMKSHYLMVTKLDLRKPADKEIKAKLEQQYDKNIIDTEAFSVLTGMYGSVFKNPAAAKVLKSVSEVELALTWVEDKVLCKAKLDAYSSQLKAIIDIKTCQSASKDDFSKAINNFSYHLQASHYLSGAKSNGLDVERFIFIAMEKDPPYANAVYLLEIGTLGTAQAQREDLLKLYNKCLTSNEWPTYSHKIEEIGLPEWASAKIEKGFLGE